MKMSKFSFFIDFFIGQFFEKLLVSKKHFFGLFRQTFFILKSFIFYELFSISIRNFPRNPKIILRKSCDEFKATKNIDSKFLYKFFLILVIFGDMLRITTLNPLGPGHNSPLGPGHNKNHFLLTRNRHNR